MPPRQVRITGFETPSRKFAKHEVGQIFGLLQQGKINMTATAQEVFTETVRALPPSEQFRLAALILQELAQSEVVVVERSDTWSEQDQSDLTAATLQYAAKLYPEEEDLV